MALQVANCIITLPHNDYAITYVMTKAFNDLSLPGKTLPEGADLKELLVASIKDKTDITIKSFKDVLYKVSFKAKGKDFERLVCVASEYEGVPYIKEDTDKYGIEIYSPPLLFTRDWRLQEGHKLAPGIGEVILRYYADMPEFSERYPAFVPLDEGNMEELIGQL